MVLGLVATLGSCPYLVLARSWALFHVLTKLQLEGGVILGFLPHLGVVSGESPRLGVAKTRIGRALGPGSRLGHAGACGRNGQTVPKQRTVAKTEIHRNRHTLRMNPSTIMAMVYQTHKHAIKHPKTYTYRQTHVSVRNENGRKMGFYNSQDPPQPEREEDNIEDDNEEVEDGMHKSSTGDNDENTDVEEDKNTLQLCKKGGITFNDSEDMVLVIRSDLGKCTEPYK
ncbi:hypothetical protein PIB30_082130 [Stylosanthes scabra]|uniref:Uncharacterized protein n=1 Tax=Stylosanthes scabra TaxID=79078 RepID=A0ABU6SSU2_9FABA|nr:hypothetical protein [Stylosanthes scabra]